MVFYQIKGAQGFTHFRLHERLNAGGESMFVAAHNI
jgi:hypothetical protein